ncbi:uncharacterized protein PAC_04392 [Phialocephala subalpina]|uniref:Uncharacterized protein n=1 Tax=Phialocephala subalpina TaxID=576137 RepID=A0A1L7WP07_9HELO|nr:uncharacterized protein PAC_04392 [Phialocephala subalpina]
MASRLQSAWNSKTNWSAHFTPVNEVSHTQSTQPQKYSPSTAVNTMETLRSFMDGLTFNKKTDFTLIDEFQFKKERDEDHKSLLRQVVKRQTLSTPYEKVEDLIFHNDILKAISVVIFDVKLTDQVTLQSRWLLKASRDKNKARFFVRDHALWQQLDPTRWEPSIKELNLLRIEQCPHCFHPSMVERCDIHASGRGWATIRDPTHVELLLEEVARLSHLVGEPGLSRDTCEAKQQVLRRVQRYQVSSDDQLQKLLEEGVLKKFEIELRSETSNVKNRERVGKWMDSIPDVGLKNAIPSVIDDDPDLSTTAGLGSQVHNDVQFYVDGYHGLKAKPMNMDVDDLVKLSYRFLERFVQGPEQIRKKSANPLISILTGGDSKPTLERNVPFLEVAKMWQSCGVVEAVRLIPSKMFDSENFTIKTRESLSDALAHDERPFELVVFRGMEVKKEMEIHDRHLNNLVREYDTWESDKILKWAWFHRTQWLDAFMSNQYDIPY